MAEATREQLSDLGWFVRRGDPRVVSLVIYAGYDGLDLFLSTGGGQDRLSGEDLADLERHAHAAVQEWFEARRLRVVVDGEAPTDEIDPGE